MQGKFHNKRTPRHITDNPFYVLFTAISAQTNEAVSPSQDLSGILKHERFLFCFQCFFFCFFFCSVYSFDTKGIRYRSCPERLSNMENVFIFNVICFYSSDLPMEEQLRRLQEERTCKVCMDKEVNIVFIPCGHLVVCKECAPSLRKCPICRGMVKGTVRTFLS